MKQIILIILFFSFLSAPAALAHQPRIIGQATRIIVVEPEVSKAYYGELKGEPAIYEIMVADPFHLYVNILVPDIAGVKKDISAEIKKDGEELAALDGAQFDWQEFYEPFGGDNYFSGPEFNQEVGAGEYIITVFSPANRGKYALAIGQLEEFPPKEILKTILVLPTLKKDFFAKSALTAYFNLSGLFLLAIIALVVAVIFIFFWIKRRKRKKSWLKREKGKEQYKNFK